MCFFMMLELGCSLKVEEIEFIIYRSRNRILDFLEYYFLCSRKNQPSKFTILEFFLALILY